MRLTTPVTRSIRLTLICVLSVAAWSACGGDGGGVIEDNLIRPGITAMNQASDLACNADRAALTKALETYEIMEGAPAIDQGALIEAGYLREASTMHEVVDGQIQPVNPDCS